MQREIKIWVDADACPRVIKEILFRAAERTGVMVTLVANQHMRVPYSNSIKFIKVASGFDRADSQIVQELRTGDLVITGDIPLAAIVIEKGGHALSHRGELFTTDTIKSRLQMRDFLDILRDSGIDTGGPPELNLSDRQTFANQLDTFLVKNTKNA